MKKKLHYATETHLRTDCGRDIRDPYESFNGGFQRGSLSVTGWERTVNLGDRPELRGMGIIVWERLSVLDDGFAEAVQKGEACARCYRINKTAVDGEIARRRYASQ